MHVHEPEARRPPLRGRAALPRRHAPRSGAAATRLPRRQRPAAAPSPAPVRKMGRRCAPGPAGARPAPGCRPPPGRCTCAAGCAPRVGRGGVAPSKLGPAADALFIWPAAPPAPLSLVPTAAGRQSSAARRAARALRDAGLAPPAGSPTRRPPGVAVLLQEGKGLQHGAVPVGHALGGRLVEQRRGDAQQHKRLLRGHPAAGLARQRGRPGMLGLLRQPPSRQSQRASKVSRRMTGAAGGAAAHDASLCCGDAAE